MGEIISSFRDLRVYKMAFELQQELSEEKCEAFMQKCLRIGQMLGTMMAHPEKFCHKTEDRRPSSALRPQSSVLRPQSPDLP